MKNKSPSFQFYPSDYLSDMKVRMLAWEERGLYIDLLCYCWREGWIPSEIETISSLTGFQDKESIETCLNLFQKHPTEELKLIHLRLEKEREKQKKWSEIQSEKGKLSGKSRRVSKLKLEPVFSRCSTSVEPNVNRNGSTQTNSSSSSSSSDNTPTPFLKKPSALGLRLGSLFGRRPDSKWNEKELKALAAVEKDSPWPDEIQLLEKYYLAEKGKEGNVLRRDILTLLNNFNGEVDRAKNYKPKKEGNGNCI